ncbi:MAG: acyltransferase [Rikenellaceae bacterium]
MNINIRAVVQSKNRDLYNKIPSFLFTLFEKIIHQDEINTILGKYSNLRGIEFIRATLNELNIEREVVIKHPLNREQDNSIILVSNHPLGGVDGFALAEAITAKYGSVKIVVNDILMNVEPVKELFIPINKHGRQSSKYAASLNDALASSVPILYFPAGLCSRKIDGKIEDLKWHNSFLKKAIEHNRDVVLVKVNSLNSSLFYTSAWLRKYFKIKANLEMILLPSELFKKRNGNIQMIFGERLKIEELKNCENIDKAVIDIRRRCYELDK